MPRTRTEESCVNVGCPGHDYDYGRLILDIGPGVKWFECALNPGHDYYHGCQRTWLVATFDGVQFKRETKIRVLPGRDWETYRPQVLKELEDFKGEYEADLAAEKKRQADEAEKERIFNLGTKRVCHNPACPVYFVEIPPFVVPQVLYCTICFGNVAHHRSDEVKTAAEWMRIALPGAVSGKSRK